MLIGGTLRWRTREVALCMRRVGKREEEEVGAAAEAPARGAAADVDAQDRYAPCRERRARAGVAHGDGAHSKVRSVLSHAHFPHMSHPILPIYHRLYFLRPELYEEK